jgi:hypothetical protein
MANKLIIVISLILLNALIFYAQETCSEVKRPKTVDQCSKAATNKTDVCCFMHLENANINTNMCLSFPTNATIIAPYMNEMIVANVTTKIKMDCGKNSKKIQEFLCGKPNPKNFEDCDKHTDFPDTPCCYFQNGRTSLCLYGGPGIDVKVAGITFKCGGEETNVTANNRTSS